LFARSAHDHEHRNLLRIGPRPHIRRSPKITPRQFFSQLSQTTGEINNKKVLAIDGSGRLLDNRAIGKDAGDLLGAAEPMRLFLLPGTNTTDLYDSVP